VLCFNAAVSTTVETTAPRAARRGLIVIAAVLLVFAVVGAALIALVLRPWGGSGDTPTVAAPAPRFIEEAEAAGLVHAYEGGDDYFVGGGVAAFDCDDDGRADLYLAGGSAPAGLFRNESPVGGGLRFTPVPSPVTDLAAVTGAYPIDIDGDAVTDLAVLRRGENVLLRGTGDCSFERANEAWGFDGGDAWTTAFSATWESGATWPTLAFGNYVASLDPDDLCQDNELVRPAGGGGAFGDAIALTPSWCALSLLFSDWSRTGLRDLRVSNDRHYYSDLSDGQEQLWRIADGAPRQYTDADGWQPVRLFGMGIASQDLSGDGIPEVYLTNQGPNRLQRLIGGPDRPTYDDIGLERNVNATRPYAGGDPLPSTAWHPEFEDVNNDGFLDLFVTKGNVSAQPDHASKDPSNLLIGQPDGTFVDGGEAAGIVEFAPARGAAVVDLDLDGLLDIVKVNRRENVGLWRNTGIAAATSAGTAAGNWAAIRLHDASPNTDAIGAWVSIKTGDRTIDREVTVGGGHASGQLGWMHLGLGPAEEAQVQVRWPDGEVGPWMTVPAGTFNTIERGAEAPRPWSPED
jgi:hypothetical protein